LFDLPTEFSTSCDAYGKPLPSHAGAKCYNPDDFDGKYRGPMTLRDALAQSINIPAVKLFYLVGMQNAFNLAENLGISTLSDLSQYGLTLVIGGGEATPLDMTSAYSVFANDGIKNADTGILKVEDSNGQTLEEYSPNPKQILNKNTALMLSDILSDNKARTPTFGANSALNIPNVAVKTGTTNNDKDAWTIGYTPSIAVGVWAGNNDNKQMKSGGSAIAAPIWNKFMTEALKTLPNETFEKPDLKTDPEKVKPILRGFWQGNQNFFIDKISGKLATANTPDDTKQEKVITNVHSILYWINKNDLNGPQPTNPSDDSQFNHWEVPIQNWWAQNSSKYPITTLADIPTELDDVHTDISKPIISITEPNGTDIYQPNQKIQLQISSTGKFPLQKIDIFINDIYLGTSTPPFSFSFVPSSLDSLKQTNELKIIAYDTAYNRVENTTTFQVQQ